MDHHTPHYLCTELVATLKGCSSEHCNRITWTNIWYIQLITQLTFGLELQEFEDLGLLGMMAFVLEMANDSGHYSSGEVAKLMAKA